MELAAEASLGWAEVLGRKGEWDLYVLLGQQTGEHPEDCKVGIWLETRQIWFPTSLVIYLSVAPQKRDISNMKLCGQQVIKPSWYCRSI